MITLIKLFPMQLAVPSKRWQVAVNTLGLTAATYHRKHTHKLVTVAIISVTTTVIWSRIVRPL